MTSYEEDAPSQGYYESEYPLNSPQRDTSRRGSNTGKWYCPITGNIASTYFFFRPNNWRELAMLVGKENLPKSVMGWNRDGHWVDGNPLLGVTDPVTGIGTLLEDREWNYRNSCEYSRVNFRFHVGFSKNGLKKLVKEAENKNCK